MKQLISFFTLLFCMSLAFGQNIVLEQTYNHSGTYTALANSGDKFYLMDVGANQCQIYNTDHTPWKNISLSVPADHYLYDIRFVSENLFTVDNALCLAYIYYNYNTVGQYYTYTAKVIRENGTELLTIPGCQYIYVLTLSDGSTKMTAYSYDYSLFPYTIQTRVYDLPGQMTSHSISDAQPLLNVLNAFPNPTHSYTTIPYELSAGELSGELFITTTDGKIVRKLAISNTRNDVSIETTQFPRGTYFYYIQSGNRRSQARKLIVN
jgi:hypothetical protein